MIKRRENPAAIKIVFHTKYYMNYQRKQGTSEMKKIKFLKIKCVRLPTNHSGRNTINSGSKTFTVMTVKLLCFSIRNIIMVWPSRNCVGNVQIQRWVFSVLRSKWSVRASRLSSIITLLTRNVRTRTIICPRFTFLTTTYRYRLLIRKLFLKKSIFWKRTIWKHKLWLRNGSKTLKRQSIISLNVAVVATCQILKEYYMVAHPQDFGSFEST